MIRANPVTPAAAVGDAELAVTVSSAIASEDALLTFAPALLGQVGAHATTRTSRTEPPICCGLAPRERSGKKFACIPGRTPITAAAGSNRVSGGRL
jgi:hypothetical protein